MRNAGVKDQNHVQQKLLLMAKEQHNVKMRVLRLQKWKLVVERCNEKQSALNIVR